MSVVYKEVFKGILAFPPEKLIMPQASKTTYERQTIMGDKSPKSVQKKSTQKQTRTSNTNLKKKQAVAAKQAAGKKK
jgi:hypothetical protein